MCRLQDYENSTSKHVNKAYSEKTALKDLSFVPSSDMDDIQNEFSDFIDLVRSKKEWRSRQLIPSESKLAMSTVITKMLGL